MSSEKKPGSDERKEAGIRVDRYRRMVYDITEKIVRNLISNN